MTVLDFERVSTIGLESSRVLAYSLVCGPLAVQVRDAEAKLREPFAFHLGPEE